MAPDLSTPRAALRRGGGLRIGLVAIAAVLVAEAGVWLMRPRGEIRDPAPVSERAYFSQAQLERAQDFRGPQRLIGLAALAVEGGTLLVLAIWRPSPVRRTLDAAARRPLLGAAAVAGGVSLTLAVTGLPFAAIAHERARDVGLATQTIGPWLSDVGKSAAIAAGLAALGGAAALAMWRRLGRRFWIGGTVLVVGYAVVSTWLAPVVLAPLFNKFERLPDGPTRSQILRLGREADVDIGQVYKVDASRRSTAINAYVNGLGPTKRVVIYDNTLRDLDPAELRSVVAHELGHVKGDDVLRGIAFVAIIAPLGVLFVQLLTERIARRNDEDLRSPALVPALALALTVASVVLAVPGQQLSRKVEARADNFALELTQDPHAFIELQRRLAVSNVADPEPPAALQFLFGTHPTTMERIGTAVTFERGRPSPPDTPAGS